MAEVNKTQSEVSVRDLIILFKKVISYLKAQWKVLLVSVILGALLALVYFFLANAQYVAKATFVLDEQNQTRNFSPNLSAFGIQSNVDGGLFRGDNLIWLYSSNRMITESLLTEAKNTSGGSEILIETFIRQNTDLQKLANRLGLKEGELGFKAKQEKEDLTYEQNSLMNSAVGIIRREHLEVATEDEADGIIAVSFKSSDELFSLNFVTEIVDRVNRFYIETKTKKAAERVAILQKKVDEFNQNLSVSMREAGLAADAIPNSNPNLPGLRVKSQRETVDVTINSQIYGTMVQQLEAAKVDLANETPLIQIIDTPLRPLNVVKPKLFIVLLAGIFGALFVTFAGFIGIFSYRVIRDTDIYR